MLLDLSVMHAYALSKTRCIKFELSRQRIQTLDDLFIFLHVACALHVLSLALTTKEGRDTIYIEQAVAIRGNNKR